MGTAQPARLSFLAIYNPILGPTDETFPDQLVFWYSRAAAKARAAAKKSGRKDDKDVLREQENEKLRQIGLAQGMVDFAKTFSNGRPVDSVETEKSRVVLLELEPGWWALASVDLTRLPPVVQNSEEPVKKYGDGAAPGPAIEYSSREVSPASVLRAQLYQAHHIFSLHHGPSLNELFVRLKREKLCHALERYWTRFAKTWNVLLSGNPAADVFDGVQLSSGGELGFGVGEEEWGSGEREVLEDLVQRTEGMVDAVVCRYGEPAKAEASDHSSLPMSEALPWMGSGAQPACTDGVIFAGVGRLTRPSLRNVSLWMRQIYSSGEYAYGIKDNPLRERRKRRRRDFAPALPSEEEDGTEAEPAITKAGLNERSRRSNSHHLGPEGLHGTFAGGDSPTKNDGAALSLRDSRESSILAQTSLQDLAKTHRNRSSPIAASQQSKTAASKATMVDARREQATKGAEQNLAADSDSAETSTTWGVPDQYMKYLTLGLSTLAKPSKPERPGVPRFDSTSNSRTMKPYRKVLTYNAVGTGIVEGDEDELPDLQHMDPTPDEEPLQVKLAKMRRRENRGHFLIGLMGGLDGLPDENEADVSEGSVLCETGGARMVLRTLQVEVTSKQAESANEDETRDETLDRRAQEFEPTEKKMQRVRVLVYVHRPFIYCFLFEGRATNLSYAGFYRTLHKELSPIHYPLLSSTNASKAALRLEEAQADTVDETASVRSARSTKTSKSASVVAGKRPVYDLVYDPQLLTVRTTIPNIPDPGTPAAEGLATGDFTTSDWTRMDAINVHSQILSTLQRTRPNELERTSRTTRGWWVVWMRVPAPATDTESSHRSPQHQHQLHHPSLTTQTTASTHMPSTVAHERPVVDRMAFLVRKAADKASTAAAAKSSTTSRVASGMWATLTLQSVAEGSARGEENVTAGGGEAVGEGTGQLANGIGIDARRYVEGLLSLNR
ncbi:hypothetical protein LTR62_006242 [Meristemomyces frigidus]|uniref:CCZ1/INTU/HSP4 first Longin domain-containing protein n=1 Tax=Meristemomyces frigidus TaxID=1508187 RepID=A0AAN7YN01_9PEZI|nr:hypothetical protein LTR62_006242 [Meristemomyces frigidus]